MKTAGGAADAGILPARRASCYTKGEPSGFPLRIHPAFCWKAGLAIPSTGRPWCGLARLADGRPGVSFPGCDRW